MKKYFSYIKNTKTNLMITISKLTFVRLFIRTLIRTYESLTQCNNKLPTPFRCENSEE